MLCTLSTKLSEHELGQIGRLEDELGHPLLAFTCYPNEPARISSEQLDKVRELESRLGISLVAVDG